MMGKTCTKCGGENTGKHPRWCPGCRRKARGKVAVTGVTAVTGGNEAALARENEGLRAEVARLKKELAGRVSRPVIAPPPPPPEPARATAFAATMTRAGLDRDQRQAHNLHQRGSTPRPATSHEVRPHGPRCQCIGCRAGGR